MSHCTNEEFFSCNIVAQRDENAAEVERLNRMRVHCQRCGADYLATGLEARCPCEFRAEVERIKEQRNDALKDLDSAREHYALTLAECKAEIEQLRKKLDEYENYEDPNDYRGMGWVDSKGRP